MTELDLIIDLHKNNPRQGPGSEKDLIKALSFMNLPKNKVLDIADIGCGTGGPTVALAKLLKANIAAVDLFPEFLAALKTNAQQTETARYINPIEASMDNLPFQKEQFDIIWSEGAIYNIGFENGIKKWKYFLKPKGYLAISELTWITQNRPSKITNFWNSAYPEVSTASKKINQLEENGFSLLGYFYLPTTSWTTHYFKPLEASFDSFLKRHNNSELAQKVVMDHKAEIQQYHKYQEYFSYGFYIAKKY